MLILTLPEPKGYLICFISHVKRQLTLELKKLPYITNGCYDPTPKETLPTENKLNAGPQDSFLARSLLNTL